MFENNRYARLRQSFADQFEPDGDAFLYRKSQRGTPIQLSAEERARYIAGFNRLVSWMIWGLPVMTIALIIAVAGYATLNKVDVSDSATYGGVGVIMALYLAAYYWVWNTPARELRGRGTVGEAMSRAGVQRLMFARMSYRQLGGAALAAGLFAFRVFTSPNPYSGMNLAWLALAALLLIGALAQAFRKYRFEAGKYPRTL